MLQCRKLTWDHVYCAPLFSNDGLTGSLRRLEVGSGHPLPESRSFSLTSVLRSLARACRGRPARRSPASSTSWRLHVDFNRRRLWYRNAVRHRVPVRGPNGRGPSRCLTGPWSPVAASVSVTRRVTTRLRDRVAVVRTSGEAATRREPARRRFDSGTGQVLLCAAVVQPGFLRRGRSRSFSRPSSSALFDGSVAADVSPTLVALIRGSRCVAAYTDRITLPPAFRRRSTTQSDCAGLLG